MKRLQMFIWPLLFIIFLIASAILFKDQRIAADTSTHPASEQSQTINSNSSVSDSQSQDANNNSDSANSSIIRDSKYMIPILMYHHIRDYSDPSDKIGTNLSVSPNDFAKELDLIKEKGYTTITFENIKSGNVPEKSIILTFDDGYENFYQNAYPELQKRGMKAVSYIIVNNIGKDTYMTRDQIIEIENGGVEIGSHTLSHPNLVSSPDTKVTSEVKDSKKYLEDIIGKNIISFCYPSGKFSRTTEALINSSGYEFAVTTKRGIATFNDLFALNRFRVNNGTSINSLIN